MVTRGNTTDSRGQPVAWMASYLIRKQHSVTISRANVRPFTYGLNDAGIFNIIAGYNVTLYHSSAGSEDGLTTLIIPHIR